MGASCTKTPVNCVDIQYAKQQSTHIHSTLRLSKHTIDPIENKNNSIDNLIKKSEISNLLSSSVSDSTLIQSHESKALQYPKSKKSKNKIPIKRRRKSVRKVSFDTNKIEVNSSDTSSLKSQSQTHSHSHVVLSDYIEYDVPNLPIRFSTNEDIWNKEYTYFTQTLSNILHTTYKMDKISSTNVTNMLLEFALIDMVYKLNYTTPINSGLWPHEYILNKSLIANNINENGMIIENIRDNLIQSFNLQSIFEICGSCFQSNRNKSLNMNMFLVSGVYKQRWNTNMNTNNNKNDDMISEYDLNACDGYTSAGDSSIFPYINPLKFKIYSHDIMVCPKGFHIEKHNEFYQQCQDNEISENSEEPSYYFTLLLLPPNIQTYKGGKYKFYGLESVNKNKCVDISADSYDWTWILFDKRVFYQCEPITNGTAITLKMDIDVWKKSSHEIKQNEQSYERINELLNGQLNIDIKNDVQINYDLQVDKIEFDSIEMELSPSPNIVFPPYPILWENL